MIIIFNLLLLQTENHFTGGYSNNRSLRSTSTSVIEASVILGKPFICYTNTLLNIH